MRRVKGKRKDNTGLSPRAYQALLDRCKLWDLVSMRTPQVQIAEIMGKDPAWVSRTLQEIQSDFSTVHATPNEVGIIQENLVRWQTLYAEARQVATASDGFKRISALRLCAELVRQKAEYEVSVGWVTNRRYGEGARGASRAPSIEELRDEISQEDLEAITLRLGDDIRERRAKEAKAKEIAALPEPSTVHS
jgi:hypothetical protein